MAKPIIQLEHLTYQVNGRTILDDITFDIAEQEIFSVLGLSGTGKTTLLRLITGLIRPTSGSLRVFGQDITVMSEDEMNVLRDRMGLVFQYGALFDSLSVRENVGFRLYERTNTPEDEVRAIVADKLRQVGLPNTEELYPAELSGGMQKRVGIARVLVGDPDLLLYDEPTSGLDPVIAGAIDELITRLRDELGVTSVVVSHDVHSVLRMSDRIALLYQGKVQYLGTPQQFHDADDPVVRQFLTGSSDGPIHVV
jgi:phospholipid/cholesterol/gamma-HCH transport system ATP-binding protein